MKKQLLILLLLFSHILILGKSSTIKKIDNVKIFFWHSASEPTPIKWVKIDLKKRTSGSVKDRTLKMDNDILGGAYLSTTVTRKGDGKDTIYIDEIEVKYNNDKSLDKTYKFEENINLSDEELKSVLLFTRKNKKQLGVYKRYRGRIRSDLRRYRKPATTSLRSIFGEDSTVRNVTSFNENLDPKMGRGKYFNRYIEGDKD